MATVDDLPNTIDLPDIEIPRKGSGPAGVVNQDGNTDFNPNLGTGGSHIETLAKVLQQNNQPDGDAPSGWGPITQDDNSTPIPGADAPVDVSNFGDLGRGAIKGIASGIPELYGIMGATVDYAANHAKGGNAQFSDELFKPGGMQAIMDEGEQFKQQYINDNPNATVGDVAQAYQEHRATPEYYNFAADQMRPGLSLGMKNAMAINQVTGLNGTTPDQEPALQQAVESIGSALLPLPGASAIPKAASEIATRIAGTVAGTATNVATKAAMMLAPGNTGGAGSAAVGAGISLALPAIAQARSHHAAPILSRGMVDPRNGQIVTSPASLSDPIEAAHSGPPITQQETTTTSVDNAQQPTPIVGPPVQQPPQLLPNQQGSTKAPSKPNPSPAPQGIQPLPSTSKVAIPQGIDSQQYAGDTPAIPGGPVGVGLAALGGAAAAYGAIKFGRGAINKVLGRSPVNVDAFGGSAIPSGGSVAPATPRAEAITNSVNIRGNLANPQTANSLPVRVLRAFDNAFNRDAPAEDQARDLGGDPLERIIQAQLGTKLSPGAKAADKARAMHIGSLPDGTALSVVPENFYKAAASMSQEQRDQFTQLIQALNIQDRRTVALNNMLNREQELIRALRTARSKRAQYMQQLADTRGYIAMRSADDPKSRITFGQVPDEVLNERILTARQDPQIRDLERMYRAISHDLSVFEYNSGLLTNGDLVARLRDTHYQPLFEFEYKAKTDTRANNDLADTTMPDAAPERAIDPWSAIAFKVSNAVDDANTNTATSRIVNAFRAADPSARVVRQVDSANPFGTVTVYNNGQPEYYQFARPAVAEALKMQRMDVGNLLNAANMMRTTFQRFVTGPLFGTLYTPIRSVMFDGLATQATHRSGRAFGVASYFAQRAAIYNPSFQRFADLVGAVDPTGPTLVTGYGFANAALTHMYGGVAHKIEQMAVTNSPVFAALGNIPGGQQQLQALGARLAHAYDSSMVHVLEQNNGVHVHQMMRDTLFAKNELESFMRRYQNAGRSDNSVGRAIDPAISAIKTLWHGYEGLLNTIHNASRYGYAAQNLSLLEHRAAARGSAVTPEEIRTLSEEVRRSAGDLAGRPGSKGLKTFEMMTPYANISFQSARHMIKAMQRDPMQVGLTMMGLSAGLYATYKVIMSRGDEAQKWYWNQANPWERVGAIRAIPKPDTLMYMAQHGGALPPWTPHDPMGDFYEISVAPEMMPYITMVMAGYEQLGLMPRPNDATSMSKDMAFSLADSLAVGTQPLINIPSIAITGQSINWTAGASGRSVFQGPQVSQGIGANAGKLQSGAPSIMPQLMQATLGLAGMTAYQMIDQGMQAYKGGQSFAEVADRVGVELTEQIKERPAVPDIPLLYNAPAKVYRSTPASRRMNDLYSLVRGQLGSGRGLDAAWSMEFGKASTTSEAATAPHVMDMQVLEMMSDVHDAYLRKGAIKDITNDANDLKKEANNYQRQKVNTPVDDITSGKFRYQLQSRLLNWQVKENEALAAAEDFNKQLADKYGDRFKKEGLPPTVEGVVKLVAKTARPLAPGEKPLSAQVQRGPKHSLVFPEGQPALH